MRKEILAYLKKRPNVEVLVLALVAIAGFCVLFFKPYRIYDWVGRNEIMLFWGEIGLLVLIIAILVHHISNLHAQINFAQAQENIASNEMYNFYDERGDMKLSVKPENLFYIETADNYVQIHYQNLGKMQVLMIRNSMKNIEWRFKDTPLVRCHRSYLVNLSKVQMIKRVEGEVQLDFNDEKIDVLPVSRAYTDRVMTYFAK